MNNRILTIIIAASFAFPFILKGLYEYYYWLWMWMVYAPTPENARLTSIHIAVIQMIFTTMFVIFNYMDRKDKR